MIMRKMLVGCMLLLVVSFSSNANTATSPCDRDCLKGFITQYLNAMVAHKTDSLAVSADVRCTEDCKEIKLGEGLFKTASGLGDYRMDFIDVRQGGTVSYVVVKEGSSSILLALRLKVVNKKISQIESMVVKDQNEGMIFNIKAFTKPSDAMTKFPAVDSLNTREDMIKIASRYPEGLKVGSFVKTDLQVTASAYRFENGQTMAEPGKIKTQALPRLSGIIYKVAAVDEELGVVVLRMNFGDSSVMNDKNNWLDVFESFKIFGGQIHAVEAIMQKIPKGTTFGWDYDVTGVVPLRMTNVKTGHNVAIVVNRGVSLPNLFSADKIAFALYTVSGRMTFAKTVVSSSAGSTVVVPLALAPGHYVGQVRYYSGNSIVHSSVFNLNYAQ